ncbi:MAG: hypothetical protein ACM3IG_04095, partial [Myxococcales bacterium]
MRLLAAASGAAFLAIAAAIMLPSSSRSSSAAAAPVPLPKVKPAALAWTKVQPAPASASDQDSRRFTGRVGANLTDSLLAAGVPVSQGREYVWLLGKAIKLSEGLSVDD